MSRISCVIFDLDGTLLDTLDDLMDSVNHILQKYGYEKRTRKEIRAFVGNGLLRLIEQCVPCGKEAPHFDDIFREFKEYYSEHSNIKTKPYSGVLDVLTELHNAGIKTAIVTNKPQNAAQELYDKYFKECVDIVVGEQEGLLRKPYPDEVNFALRSLCANADEAIYVGDSEVDKKTADNSNLPCVLVTWGFRDADELLSLSPYAMVNEANEIVDIVKNA